MKNITNFINEVSFGGSTLSRAAEGNVLEVELNKDGHFYWHTEEDSDWSKFTKMKPWELMAGDGNNFYIKIGKISDIK